MGKSRFSMKKLSFHKKTIAIESRIERTVEDEGRSGDADWRTKLEPTVSVSIRRGSDVIVDGKRSTSVDDPLVCIRAQSKLERTWLMRYTELANMETRGRLHISDPSHQHSIITQTRPSSTKCSPF